MITTCPHSSSTATPIFTDNYKAYGVSYGRSGSSTFQYTDKPADSATRLYYSGARWYDPASGRFMTEDTYMGDLAVPLSLNRYIYALDNPMRYVDPTGHESTTPTTSTIYYTVTTSQTTTWTEWGLTNYYTLITTTTYATTTTCYGQEGCSSSTVVIAVSYAWIYYVFAAATDQLCTSSSSQVQMTCTGSPGPQPSMLTKIANLACAILVTFGIGVLTFEYADNLFIPIAEAAPLIPNAQAALVVEALNGGVVLGGADATWSAAYYTVTNGLNATPEGALGAGEGGFAAFMRWVWSQVAS
jgi:RHS repeat-associated protein